MVVRALLLFPSLYDAKMFKSSCMIRAAEPTICPTQIYPHSIGNILCSCIPCDAYAYHVMHLHIIRWDMLLAGVLCWQKWLCMASWSLVMAKVALPLQVRAFTPWPGTKQKFILQPDADSVGIDEEYSIKIVKTVVGKAEDWSGEEDTDITVTKEALHIKCNDGTVLSVLRLQMPSKRPISPVAFMNGVLQNMTIHRLQDVDESEGSSPILE